MANPALEEDFDGEPLETSSGVYGEFQLVGHGSVTNGYCGKHIKLKGCSRVELHDRIRLDGQSFKGKVYVKDVQHWCDRPSCPTCFKHGWAVREAGNVRDRLAAASKHWGQVEHIVCSVPVKDWGLSFEALRRKAVVVLYSCGIVGGCLIFHGFRYNLQKQWYWSPHWHILGFVHGGFGRCRHCRNTRFGNCAECGGFMDRVYKLYHENGYIVKVLGERETVFGTAWYQLEHSSIKVGVVRFQVATWWGICSYRKLKVTIEKREALCPICRNGLIDIRYLGAKKFVWDRSSSEYKHERYEDYEEDGRVVWSESIEDG